MLMQQLIVILIGIVVFGYAFYKAYKTISHKSSSESKCGSCDSCAPIRKN
ncbi:MAG: FeoB-associated Cys-rich membrane protein [Paludibacteraceae bacterium]